jgi:orotate phosphoribosyltransferase-like protein
MRAEFDLIEHCKKIQDRYEIFKQELSIELNIPVETIEYIIAAEEGFDINNGLLNPGLYGYNYDCN